MIAATVTECPDVIALHPGGLTPVATYLPGRRVVGVQTDDEHIRVAVVGALGVPVPELVVQIRQALAPFALGRSVDIHVADLEERPVAAPPVRPARRP